MNKSSLLIKKQLKKDLPEIRPGDTIRIYQRYDKQIQMFEGVVIAKKHGKGISSTITVRKVISGVGVEKIFPLHSPTIEKIQVLKRGKTRRAKLYYLRKAKGKKARLKKKELEGAVVWEKETKSEKEKEEKTEAKTTTKEEKKEQKDEQKNEQKDEQKESIKEEKTSSSSSS